MLHLKCPRIWLAIGVGITTLIYHPQINAQTCLATIERSTPDGTFQDNGNGTVTDSRHELMWKRCAEGQNWDDSTCIGTAATHTWEAALTTAATTSFAGYEDWRLPNIKELHTIVEVACYNPTINLTTFPNTPASLFWSSSPRYDAAGDSWALTFDNGSDYYGYGRSGGFFIRLVRGGQ